MFAVKGSFYDTPSIGRLRCRTGYILVDNGLIIDFFDELPAQYAGVDIHDYTGRLIVPGMSDLHLHASQYRYCGTAMDVALLEWLNDYAYPEEARFADPEYAETLYTAFVNDLMAVSTTRACCFATIHTDATLILMDKLEEKGFISYVGKLNIDRNSPDYYRERSVSEGVSETVRWLEACRSRAYKYCLPMITPRFTPSVTDDYMKELGRLAAEYDLPVQSHLSENKDEIEWVRALCPDTDFYAQSYSRYGLFGPERPVVMAHCIYSGPEELQLMRENGVMIAHCPSSNENVIAGISPAAKYLREGYRIGLGSDVAGGHTLNLFASMVDAVQVSKLRWMLISSDEKPLSIIDAFYLATVGGGSFFGKVGAFEPGWEFDAAVLDDRAFVSPIELSPGDRLERYAYRGSGIAEAKYIRGRKVV